MTAENLYDYIHSYQTKHPEGFTSVEMLSVINLLGLDVEKVSAAIGINTGLNKEGESLTFHGDFYRGLRNVIFRTETSAAEWD
jgi:hypothetical protein